MPHIDYFLATFSPSVYIAGTRLEEIAARHAATVTYRPLDLMGLFARSGGLPPAQRHVSRQEYRLQDLARQARKAHLPFNPRPAFFPPNPAPSSFAVIAAQKSGAGNTGALVHALARAVWAEDRDIADDGTIREILRAEGFDPGLADADMLASAEEYGGNLEKAVLQGAFGVPFYITDADQRFWGQDRLDDLDRTLAGDL